MLGNCRAAAETHLNLSISFRYTFMCDSSVWHYSHAFSFECASTPRFGHESMLNKVFLCNSQNHMPQISTQLSTSFVYFVHYYVDSPGVFAQLNFIYQFWHRKKYLKMHFEGENVSNVLNLWLDTWQWQTCIFESRQGSRNCSYILDCLLNSLHIGKTHIFQSNVVSKFHEKVLLQFLPAMI